MAAEDNFLRLDWFGTLTELQKRVFDGDFGPEDVMCADVSNYERAFCIELLGEIYD